ncbi:MAG TPA: nuclear transport factor 2 family protein [Phycisphaerales bacterium]|nr:nuclear transport factor 2 family protein [Phycisphaerales bacterium]
MAKKRAKKPARSAKPARKAGRAAAKTGRKKTVKAPAKKAGKKAAKAPDTISTGAGATPAELGRTLVTLFNQNKADDWIKGVWSKNVESIEGTGQVARGPAQILAKWDWWTSNHEVMGASAEGPYVGATGFATKYQLHVKDKSTGADLHMTEVAVYTVEKGRITREEFMYSS